METPCWSELAVRVFSSRTSKSKRRLSIFMTADFKESLQCKHNFILRTKVFQYTK